MGLSLEVKAPDEVRDYSIDWTTRLLSGDTIATSSYVLDSGITEVATSKTDTATVIRISGGTLGERYKVENEVVTVDGEVLEEVFYIAVRETE